ncbi:MULTISPECIES: DUF1641 domain-containing protein [Alphaproteobacteria]|uniref:DUF1641 domain-containing protein n=1 Tax=Alphaproteobacteria TaxID=28211 RepID=UPI000DDF25C6|nr:MULTISPECIES: DUF1641 domain-containing protein [Alphaproteobacteria]MBY6001339.1 DUF1641 domain-containing protein [Tritonibacter mobilis]
MNDTVMDTPEAAAGAPKALAAMDEATERGLAELLEKLAPLLQGRRLHNLVDLASLASDGVDMFDDAMVQKLMKAYEESVGAAWNVGNAARYAATQTAQAQVPSLLGLLRVAGNEDVRRGLYFALTFLSVLGRQMKDDGVE